jgi:hypothetical protein
MLRPARTMTTKPFAFRDGDGNIRLDEALGERYVRHYVGILESSNERFREMQLTAAVVTALPEDPDRAWYAWQEPRGSQADGFTLVTEGRGPDTCSSSTALALLPEIVWDVCGYYRALGFHWTEFRQVSRKSIRHRWIALDPSQADGELAYAAQQLLDPIIRRAYDLQPPGGLFLGDRRVREMLERHAARIAAQQNAEAAVTGEEVTDHAEVLREWGFTKNVTPEQAREQLRQQYEAESEPLGTAGGALGATLSGWDRHWSYYRLVDQFTWEGRSQEPSAASLEAWQVMLCVALSEAGATVQFAVGTWPGTGPKMWRDGKETCIFFIGTEPPTREAASQAAGMFLGT